MTSHLTPTLNFIWWAEIALQILVVILGVAIRANRRYDKFLFYVGFLAAWSLANRAVVDSYAAYFYVYWVGSFFEQIILVAVIWELKKPLIDPWWIVPVDVQRGFYWTLGILLASDIVLTACFRSTLAEQFGPDWWSLGFARTLQLSVTYLMAGAMFAGVSLTLCLGIPWLHKPSLLVAGLLAKFGMEVCFWFAVISAGSGKAVSWAWMYEAARILACMVWLAGMCVREKPEIQIDQQAANALRRASENLLGEVREFCRDTGKVCGYGSR